MNAYPETILEEDTQWRQQDGQQHIHESIRASWTDRHLSSLKDQRNLVTLTANDSIATLRLRRTRNKTLKLVTELSCVLWSPCFWCEKMRTEMTPGSLCWRICLPCGSCPKRHLLVPENIHSFAAWSGMEARPEFMAGIRPSISQFHFTDARLVFTLPHYSSSVVRN